MFKALVKIQKGSLFLVLFCLLLTACNSNKDQAVEQKVDSLTLDTLKTTPPSPPTPKPSTQSKSPVIESIQIAPNSDQLDVSIDVKDEDSQDTDIHILVVHFEKSVAPAQNDIDWSAAQTVTKGDKYTIASPEIGKTYVVFVKVVDEKNNEAISSQEYTFTKGTVIKPVVGSGKSPTIQSIQIASDATGANLEATIDVKDEDSQDADLKISAIHFEKSVAPAQAAVDWSAAQKLVKGDKYIVANPEDGKTYVVFVKVVDEKNNEAVSSQEYTFVKPIPPPPPAPVGVPVLIKRTVDLQTISVYDKKQLITDHPKITSLKVPQGYTQKGVPYVTDSEMIFRAIIDLPDFAKITSITKFQIKLSKVTRSYGASETIPKKLPNLFSNQIFCLIPGKCSGKDANVNTLFSDLSIDGKMFTIPYTVKANEKPKSAIFAGKENVELDLLKLLELDPNKPQDWLAEFASANYADPNYKKILFSIANQIYAESGKLVMEYTELDGDPNKKPAAMGRAIAGPEDEQKIKGPKKPVAPKTVAHATWPSAGSTMGGGPPGALPQVVPTTNRKDFCGLLGTFYGSQQDMVQKVLNPLRKVMSTSPLNQRYSIFYGPRAVGDQWAVGLHPSSGNVFEDDTKINRDLDTVNTGLTAAGSTITFNILKCSAMR